MNLVFCFILKNIEDGGFRYFYAHENITLLERSKLVCTHDDLVKLKHLLTKTDVIESCSRETMNRKWRFYRLTNLTVFAALLNDVRMGCKNAVLPEPLLKNHTINCLRYEEKTRQSYNNNLCVFSALALHLHGTQRLEEETTKWFKLFINKRDGLSTNQIQRVHMNDIPIVEDLLTLQFLCGGHSGRCWWSKFEREIWFFRKLFDRYWNREWKLQSLQLCHVILRPSICLCSKIKWIIYSKNWNVLQKLTLHLDSFWKILRMERVDAFTFMRTILLLKIYTCVYISWHD